MSGEDGAMKEVCAGDPRLCLLPLLEGHRVSWGGRRPCAPSHAPGSVLECFGDGDGMGLSTCHGSSPPPPRAPLEYAMVALAHMVQGLLIHF